MSQVVISEVIRDAIGFDGVLVTDDLSMAALGGDYSARASRSLAAGCDLVLHCNGKAEEMMAVMNGTGPLSAEATRRLTAAVSPAAPEEVDMAALAARLDRMLDPGG
jgi:beta-N-acetylhexosaminidase